MSFIVIATLFANSCLFSASGSMDARRLSGSSSTTAPSLLPNALILFALDVGLPTNSTCWRVAEDLMLP